MKNNRILIAGLSIMMLFSGWAQQSEAAAPGAPDAKEPEEGTVVVLEAPAVIGRLDRGDTVEILGEEEAYENYWIVRVGNRYGYVEKKFLRGEKEEEYEPWIGYTRSDTVLYTGYFRTEKTEEQPKAYEELKVLDEIDDVYVVEWKKPEEKKKDVEKSEKEKKEAEKSEKETEKKEEESVIAVTPVKSVRKNRHDYTYYDYSGSSGGGGGGSGGGGPSYADGGNITLSARHSSGGRFVPLGAMVEQKNRTVVGNAVVRLDNTPLIVAFYNRGEILTITERDEEVSKLNIFGLEAEVETRFLRFEDSEKFVTFTGYARQNAALYDNPWLVSKSEALVKNTKLTVLADLGNCYLVEGEKFTGYITIKEVSKEKLAQTYYYNNGGGGGGSSSGGGGGDGGWTAPLM